MARCSQIYRCMYFVVVLLLKVRSPVGIYSFQSNSMCGLSLHPCARGAGMPCSYPASWSESSGRVAVKQFVGSVHHRMPQLVIWVGINSLNPVNCNAPNCQRYVYTYTALLELQSDTLEVSFHYCYYTRSVCEKYVLVCFHQASYCSLIRD
jgi:hypothetical protein